MGVVKEQNRPAHSHHLVHVITKSIYTERSNLTKRAFSARLTLKTLAFSKHVQAHEETTT